MPSRPCFYSATLAAMLLLLTGCGLPGAPQPPSLHLPRPVTDLQATRKGERVLLTWRTPRLSTDGERLRSLGPTRICRSTQPALPASQPPVPPASCAQVAEAPPSAMPTGNHASESNYSDTLPAELQQQQSVGAAIYTIEVLNENGRGAGMSNVVAVPLAPTRPPPPQVFAQVTKDGPVISWTEDIKSRQPPAAGIGITYGFRVSRRDKSKPNLAPVVVPSESAFVSPRLPQPNENVLDSSAEWEKTYVYWVTPITTLKQGDQSMEIEGADSTPVEVFVHDVFPPATPAGVQAVFSAEGNLRFIDLTWQPGLEPDLAGYNVYRREAGSVAQKINTQVVKAPAFRDANVAGGHTYLYSVSAVDLRGNESARSAEASEMVPP